MTTTNGAGLLKHNGVTTQPKQCPRKRLHDRHLWQPLAVAEHFTCFGNLPTSSAVPATHSGRPAQHSGSADCPYCGNAYLKARIPEHVRADHPDQWETFDRLVENNALHRLAQAPEMSDRNLAIADKIARKLGIPLSEVCGHFEEYAKRVECIQAGNHEEPLRPHPFVTRATHPNKSAENLRFCARLDCDRLWSDDVHDPSTFDASDLRTTDEVNELVGAIERLMAQANDQWNAGTEHEGVPWLEWVSGVIAEGLADVKAPEQPRTGFHAWWVAMADEAAPTIQRKAAEYGSNSLAEMGRTVGRFQRREVDDATALEIGCAMYAKGKMERVIDAVIQGKLPSTDTWHDLGVYSAMAQFIRAHGRWP